MLKKMTKLKIISLTVKGLDCAACAEKIEKALIRHEGIKGVTVYLGVEKVDIQFDPSIIKEKSIIGTINSLGYKVLTKKEEAPKNFS